MSTRATYSIPTGSALRCVVSVTKSPVDTAAVFVHGFKGDAEDTWTDFQRMMSESPEFDSWDAFYIGYASDREQIGETAYNLTRFLRKLYPSPPDDWFVKAQPRSVKFIRLREASETKYKRLILIGHSQGGVVIRQSIYNEVFDASRADTRICEGICQANVALFSPALFGIFLSGWKGIVGETSVWKAASAILSKSPSFKQLQPMKSTFLKDLQRDTEKLADSTFEKYEGLGVRIAWAREDKVVQTGGRYECDPSVEFLGSGHSFVCKPNMRYRDPLYFVLRGISK